MRRAGWLIAALFALALPALALDPSEMLDDPVLEARARGLDHELRCVKCQAESIASSNADWARDARREVREMIAAGATDQEVRDAFLRNYGDFVLMNPPASGWNLIVWLAGPALLLAGLGVVIAAQRQRNAARGPEALDPEEEARLKELLGEDG
ncbi:cytochrome c-type biogenesis protein CcmH [Vannielia litorea]|uniref:cytochrome c-type biogenesis protein n=1 Tax=Vannielia litorea TaxID=1217970 RepID=UPI001C93CB30|nr:cytochrome c-type biogenesis protein [Vannielia litorea]MBY6047752.1 cytochrome c-type biogenesis protein CcmH [Vannielia litorea]MBY6075166.1 cytochrome c-type biogenesis protein CcmH [Vannielia litorea]